MSNYSRDINEEMQHTWLDRGDKCRGRELEKYGGNVVRYPDSLPRLHFTAVVRSLPSASRFSPAALPCQALSADALYYRVAEPAVNF